MSITGDRIKDLRKQQGLTQMQLAEKLGCAVSVIGGAESGKRGISKKLASKLANFFETNIDYWFDDNAELEFIKNSKEFEHTSLIIKSLINNKTINSKNIHNIKLVVDSDTKDCLSETVLNLIKDVLLLDIDIILKKDEQ